MTNDSLQLMAPHPKRHGEAMIDLCTKVFNLPYFPYSEHCRKRYINHSHYDWNVSRIGLLDGTMVSHFGVWGYETRMGSAQLRTGGIGLVATHPEYRKRGLMEQTTRASLEAMRTHGYDISILFGLENFYHRFGYTRAWSDTTLVVKISDLPTEHPTVRVRKYNPIRRAPLDALYNQYHATVTGTAVRSTFQVLCDPYNGAKPEWYAWQDATGAWAGYLAVAPQGNRLVCFEVCGDADEALRVLASVGRKAHCAEIVFETLPYMSDLAKRLRRGSCRVETSYIKCGGAMARILNLRGTLEKCCGELSRRLQSSTLAAWQGHLVVDNAEEQVMLAIARGQVTLAEMAATPHQLRGGAEIVQLILGTDTPTEICEAHQVQLAGDAAPLAQALFPAQYPQLSRFDRY